MPDGCGDGTADSLRIGMSFFANRFHLETVSDAPFLFGTKDAMIKRNVSLCETERWMLFDIRCKKKNTAGSKLERVGGRRLVLRFPGEEAL